ncbi:MAG TPA: cysteine peptidase family C39 domain-containing protein, partial [Nitrososphaera sp.]|nr:cysteine peptidase family C39 domain-containing protein [Nitrososphaera sp.]
MNKELTVLTARIDRFFRVWYRTLSDVWIRLHAGLFGRRRVPTVYQMSAVECGAACLAMILGYYGRKISASESREICGVGRDGVTARTIADSARQFGLRVKAFSLEPPALKYLSLPAIAHWNFNHFVVVETWSKKVVEIVDPGEGRRTLTPEEFDSCFTGVVLTFEPGNQFTHHGHRKDVLWLKYLKSILYAPGARGVLAQVLLTSLFLQIMGLALPLLTKVLV